MDKATLKRAFNRGLVSEGFTRRGSNNWYISGEDLVLVLNLQKASYSNLWWLNMGIWISDLGRNPWPQEHKCHVKSRVLSLWPREREVEIMDMFDLDWDGPSDDEWSDMLETFAREELAPMCKPLIDKQTLIEAIKAGTRTQFQVVVSAFEWIGYPFS